VKNMRTEKEIMDAVRVSLAAIEAGGYRMNATMKLIKHKLLWILEEVKDD